jgi:hypothetical protein
MDEDNSDIDDQKNFKEMIKKIENNPINKKYEKLLELIETSINNIKNKSINEILYQSLTIFFEIIQKINYKKLAILKNKLCMLFHKLHQLSVFNLLITYCHFIEKISTNIYSKKSEFIFKTQNFFFKNFFKLGNKIYIFEKHIGKISI